MPMEISLADRLLQVFNTCGINAIVVNAPASDPRMFAVSIHCPNQISIMDNIVSPIYLIGKNFRNVRDYYYNLSLDVNFLCFNLFSKLCLYS